MRTCQNRSGSWALGQLNNTRGSFNRIRNTLIMCILFVPVFEYFLAAQEKIKPPDYAFLFLDLRGAPSRFITADPGLCPNFHSLARRGVTVLNLDTAGKKQEELLGKLLKINGKDIFEIAENKFQADQTWLLSTNANRFFLEEKKANLFAPDVRYSPFKKLISRFGLPSCLTNKDLSMIESFRAQYAPIPDPGATYLAELLSGKLATDHPGSIVFYRFDQLLESCRVSFAVIILLNPTTKSKSTHQIKEIVRNTDISMSKVCDFLSKEPYRNHTAISYLSLPSSDLEGEKSKENLKPQGYALFVGPTFKRGIVIQKTISIESAKTAFLAGAGLSKIPQSLILFWRGS